MKKTLLAGAFCLLVSIHLTGCATWSSDKKAYCRALRSKIVFNGTTLNTRDNEISRAQQDLQQSNYNDDCTPNG